MAKKKRKKKGWYPAFLKRFRDQSIGLAEKYIAYIGGDRTQSDPGTSWDAVEASSRAVYGGIPSYEALSSIYGRRLSPREYQHEVANIAQYTHGQIRWVNLGMPAYVLDADTVGMLSMTDVSRVKQADLLFPFQTFLVVLEPGSPLYMDVEGGAREVRLIWVHHYQNRQGRMGLHITPSTYKVGLPRAFAYKSGGTVGDWIKEIAQKGSEWGMGLTDLDREAVEATLRLVVSLALHLTAEKPSKAKPQHKVPEKRLARQDLPLPTDWIVAPIVMPGDVKEAVKRAGAKVQGKLTLRHVVQGHWKRQPFGAGRAMRKYIRVDPYWRGTGPEAGARVVRRRKKNPKRARAALRRLMRL